MDFEIPLLVLAGIGLLGTSSSPSISSTKIPNKYIPESQPNFKEQLNSILYNLENKLQIYGLRDYFMTIAWIESRYYPSAINYEPGKGWAFDSSSVPKLFPKNPWKNYKYLWEYTGGLFQLFPYNALNTWDKSANNLAPTTVFNPIYSICYAIDFAYRLQKKYDAQTWLDIRLGWHSLGALFNKPGDTVIAVENRLLKSTKENGINPDFLYELVDLSSYEKYGFYKLIKTLL